MQNKLLFIALFTLFSLPLLANDGWYTEVLDLKGYWKFSIGDREEWANPAFNDSYWEELKVPGSWEDQGFHGFDGFGWYRTSFNGKKLMEEHDYYLFLGYVDDVDEVYFNGEKIGRKGSFPPFYKTAYYAKGVYVISKDLINFEGENTIAVRVYDETHSGGILSGKIGIYKLKYEMPVKKSLEGFWKFHEGSRNNWIDQSFDDSDWTEIMLPHKWKEHGNYGGKGTYRTTFRLSGSEAKERYLLIMGKIDDFDYTYINGKEVGRTDDSRRFGDSQSWQQLRVYTVPDGLLKPGVNQLTVVVEDLGLDAGIYEGPFLIIPEKYATRYMRYNFGGF